MNDKLQLLFNECKDELNSIGIDLNSKNIGEINISVGKRACKRYGCCKQESPIETSKYIEKIGRKRYVRYALFRKHNIEISKWVMNLNSDIIKNTIMHEIIHCLPNCSNHGEEFKNYAKYINFKLGYDISRLGDKKKDLIDSDIPVEKEKFNYKIECSECGYNFFRKRMNCNFPRKYRCGKCGGRFMVYKGVFYQE